MHKTNSQPRQKSFLRRFWWLILILAILLTAGGVFVAAQKRSGDPSILGAILPSVGAYPACPSDLSGILTAPLMDPQYIAYLVPLGNINPPGHTSPVDHVYFFTTYDDQVPLYAPADAWITHILEVSANDGTGNYVPSDYAITFTICEGLVLDLAGYTDLSPALKAELAGQHPDCKYGILKPGHDNAGEGQCTYRLNLPVKAGEEIGSAQQESADVGHNQLFEVWAANYNLPSRSDVDWNYYRDERYAHAFCLFDLYQGDLKAGYYSKFGFNQATKDLQTGVTTEQITPRTIEPLCGQINQDIPGTIQGMWFGEAPQANTSSEFAGKGLAFLHNNIDPTQAEISIGGYFTQQAGAIIFTPAHAGVIDREPGEVSADELVYCYNTYSSSGITGKILVELVDEHHLKIENQPGSCSENEVFANPFMYER
jgi:hypothetical protein